MVYDIRDDGNRANLAKALQRFGLSRVQYSGFRGELNPHDRVELAREVERFVVDDIDCIFIVPLCSRCLSTARVISKSGRTLIRDTNVDIV